MFKKLVAIAASTVLVTTGFNTPVQAHHPNPSPLLTDLCNYVGVGGTLQDWLDINLDGRADSTLMVTLATTAIETYQHCPNVGDLVKLFINASPGSGSSVDLDAISSIDASACRKFAIFHKFPRTVAEAIKEHCEKQGVFGIKVTGLIEDDCPPIADKPYSHSTATELSADEAKEQEEMYNRPLPAEETFNTTDSSYCKSI